MGHHNPTVIDWMGCAEYVFSGGLYECLWPALRWYFLPTALLSWGEKLEWSYDHCVHETSSSTLTLQVRALTKRSGFIIRASLFRFPIIFLKFGAPNGVHGVGRKFWEDFGGLFFLLLFSLSLRVACIINICLCYYWVAWFVPQP